MSKECYLKTEETNGRFFKIADKSIVTVNMISNSINANTGLYYEERLLPSNKEEFEEARTKVLAYLSNL